MIHSKSKNPDEILEFAEKYQVVLNDLNLKKPLVCVPTTYNKITGILLVCSSCWSFSLTSKKSYDFKNLPDRSA